jgi:hypothetical protein
MRSKKLLFSGSFADAGEPVGAETGSASDLMPGAGA